MTTVDARLARLEERMTALAADLQEARTEQDRHRGRIHALESESAAIKALAETVRELPSHMRELAVSSASQAVQAALESSAITELRADVRALLLGSARLDGEHAGRQGERSRWLESRRFVVTTLVALACGLIAAVATLVWLAVSG